MGLFARKISSYFHSFTLSGAHASLPFPTFSRSHALTRSLLPLLSLLPLPHSRDAIFSLCTFFFANYLFSLPIIFEVLVVA